MQIVHMAIHFVHWVQGLKSLFLNVFAKKVLFKKSHYHETAICAVILSNISIGTNVLIFLETFGNNQSFNLGEDVSLMVYPRVLFCTTYLLLSVTLVRRKSYEISQRKIQLHRRLLLQPFNICQQAC